MSKRLTKRMLHGMLMAAGIPLHRWGKGQAKTFAKLFHSMFVGEIELRFMQLNQQAVLALYCRKVKVYIYCEVDGKIYYLHEVQRIRNGNKFGFSRGRSVSEKMHLNETPEDAALRGIIEELHLAALLLDAETTPVFERRGHYFGRPRPSNSWPGLFTMGPRYRLVCKLHPELFNPDGHKQFENRIHVATFKWRQVSPEELAEILPLSKVS